MTLTIPTFSLESIGPWITLSVFAIAILLTDALSPKGNRTAAPVLALVGLAVAGFQTVSLWGKTGMDFARMVYVDNFSFFFYIVFILGTGLTVLLSLQYLKDYGKNLAEYYALLLFATVGMMLMASGSHLIMIFLGIEVMSIAVYVLAGLFREDARSNEAALKYLLLGAFASAFLLFGMAMLYGASGGTLFLNDLPARLAGAETFKPLTLLAVALLIVGFGFKVASVPFHMWTPDVYEGAPTSVTAFMAVGVKAAAFAAFARVFFLAFPVLQPDWQMVLWVLAVATMTLGNIVAIAQTNIKRMLAYSSIAHAGYLLVAIIAANQLGAVSLMYYLLAYTLMNLGAFGVVILVGRKKDSYLSIYDYSGLGFQHPVLAASMALFMFALAGIPPTAGFVGKFYVFSAAVQAGYIWLAIIGVMNSVVSVYYYLRITVLMYMKPAEADLGPVSFAPAVTATLALTALGVLLIGVFPGFIYDLAMNSVKVFPGLL
ncbi:MAG: NADH-quinone oxidoreductase subunit N [Deltaproteobacteria bacterium]|nr:NADH-quinone oxidoreductase subunit N [Deltaproteobacteria bacterium]MBI4794446.1 NADH-quinone oxidoreductase subunit N [Deltaproteobacteria bacterium]